MSSQMELLSSQFNTLLTQYQNTYQEFINAVDMSSTMVTVPNTAYVGGNKLNVIQNSDISSCTSSCESTPNCSGATFSTKKNSCTLSSGMGNITSSNNQSAIVEQALYYSYQLQQINEQLITINESMMKLSNSSLSQFNDTQSKAAQYATQLKQNYYVLESERGEIAEMVREYERLNSTYDNGTIYVNSYYYSYLFYLIIAGILLGALFMTNVSSGGSSSMQYGGGGKQHCPNYILFAFLICVVVGNSYIKSML